MAIASRSADTSSTACSSAISISCWSKDEAGGPAPRPDRARGDLHCRGVPEVERTVAAVCRVHLNFQAGLVGLAGADSTRPALVRTAARNLDPLGIRASLVGPYRESVAGIVFRCADPV